MNPATTSETDELLVEIRRLSEMVDKSLTRPVADRKLLHALTNVLLARLERLAALDARALYRIAR